MKCVHLACKLYNIEAQWISEDGTLAYCNKHIKYIEGIQSLLEKQHKFKEIDKSQ